MEALNVIYNNLSENMFSKTREHIDETMGEYDDSEPSRIPDKWTVPEFDTTLTRYADKKNEGIISTKPSIRMNKLDLQEDDQSLGGYMRCVTTKIPLMLMRHVLVDVITETGMINTQTIVAESSEK